MEKLWPSSFDSFRAVVNMFGGFNVNSLYTRFQNVKLVGSLNATIDNNDRFPALKDRFDATASYLRGTGIPYGIGISLTHAYPRGILNKYPDQTLHTDLFLEEEFRQSFPVVSPNKPTYDRKEIDYSKPDTREKAAAAFSKIINSVECNHVFFDNFTVNDSMSKSNTFSDLMKVIKRVKERTGKLIIVNSSLSLNFWKQEYVDQFNEVCDGVCFEIYCRFRKRENEVRRTLSYARQLLTNNKLVLLCPIYGVPDLISCLRFSYLVSEGNDPIFVGDTWYRDKHEEFTKLEEEIVANGPPISQARVNPDASILRLYKNKEVMLNLYENLPNLE